MNRLSCGLCCSTACNSLVLKLHPNGEEVKDELLFMVCSEETLCYVIKPSAVVRAAYWSHFAGRDRGRLQTMQAVSCTSCCPTTVGRTLSLKCMASQS